MRLLLAWRESRCKRSESVVEHDDVFAYNISSLRYKRARVDDLARTRAGRGECRTE